MTDWLPELTDDDLTTLVEALESWESKGTAGALMSDIMGAMMAGDNPRAQAAVEEHRRADQLKRDRETAVRKERSVLLRAKLLTLRERRRVERLAANAVREDPR
jgi:hypothetical protein